MKFFSAQFSFFFEKGSRKNLRLLLRFLLVLSGLVALFSVLFHVIMEFEEQKYSWVTGVYWTLTVMSTLGFGDITFHSDTGRVFSVVVLLSGMIFLLILLPFTFIEFFYAPWMKAQRSAAAPRTLPRETKGHVILTHFDAVTNALIGQLRQYRYPHVLLVGTPDEALDMHEEGYSVIVGSPDDPETYLRCRVEDAAMVVATGADAINTNVAFTVRELSRLVPVVTTASNVNAVDILELAGSTTVLRLDDMMGRALVRHTIGGDAQAHLLGEFGEIQVAEARVAGTPLQGKTLLESRLREHIGVMVVGVWERGSFLVAGPNTKLTDSTVLLLAGTEEQIARYNELFCIYHVEGAPVVILGGGRVGRATGHHLRKRQIDYRIVEELPERILDSEKYVLGSAADLATLERAGIRDAPAVMITTHSDDENIYLTIYCRRLRPDIQIITRTSLEKNVNTLHRAGADFVLSYASMGANAIFGLLDRADVLTVAEGLRIFRASVPEELGCQTIREASIRDGTGCHIIALDSEGEVQVNPGPETELTTGARIILAGTPEAQRSFLQRYGVEATR